MRNFVFLCFFVAIIGALGRFPLCVLGKLCEIPFSKPEKWGEDPLTLLGSSIELFGPC